MTTQARLIDLSRSYTAAEFEALPDDGNRYELLNGKLVKMPAPGGEHGTLSKKLVKGILLHDLEEKLGKLWFTTGFVLSSDYVPEPDIMYFVAGSVPLDTKGATPAIPDLAVEIWSPSQLTKNGPDKASLDKIQRYLDAGVRLIWSVNPNDKTISVYRQGQTLPQVLGLQDELDGENIIPGFKLSLQDFFV